MFVRHPTPSLALVSKPTGYRDNLHNQNRLTSYVFIYANPHAKASGDPRLGPGQILIQLSQYSPPGGVRACCRRYALLAVTLLIQILRGIIHSFQDQGNLSIGEVRVTDPVKHIPKTILQHNSHVSPGSELG